MRRVISGAALVLWLPLAVTGRMGTLHQNAPLYRRSLRMQLRTGVNVIGGSARFCATRLSVEDPQV